MERLLSMCVHVQKSGSTQTLATMVNCWYPKDQKNKGRKSCCVSLETMGVMRRRCLATAVVVERHRNRLKLSRRMRKDLNFLFHVSHWLYPTRSQLPRELRRCSSKGQPLGTQNNKMQRSDWGQGKMTKDIQCNSSLVSPK